MHVVAAANPASAETPKGYARRSRGFRKISYADRPSGSVHMGVSVCSLDADGFIAPHLHSFEESFFVLEGELLVRIGERSAHLIPGDYGLISTGTTHAWKSASPHPARWLEMQAPQPRDPDHGRDTFFVAGDPPPQGEPVDDSTFPGGRLGHFSEADLPRPGAPSEMEGFNPVTGVAIKMFVDRSRGAIHQSLFLIQYLPGASIDLHDHTFEESYYIISGEVEATADGQIHHLGPGSTIWTGVGCLHAFANRSAEPVRWIETQAPLPPAQEVFRFERDWADHADPL